MIRVRKLLHITVGITLGALYFFISKSLYVELLFILGVASILIHPLLPKLPLYKEGEVLGGGFTSMILSFLLSSILLSRDLFLAFFVILVFGDGMSGYFGSFAKLRLPWSSKSLEGVVAFIVFSMPLLLYSPTPTFAILIALSAFVESFDIWDDNIALAITAALVGRYL